MSATLFGTSGAVISDNGLHRYRLIRDLRIGARAEKRMAFVMLNPSTADATEDDPTIRKCVGFARREACNVLDVVNLFAYRTPHPKVLREALGAGIDIEGVDNLCHVTDAVNRAALIVVAWGANIAGLPWSNVERHVREWALDDDRFVCLGRTKDDHPRHPLARGKQFVPANQPLIRWDR